MKDSFGREIDYLRVSVTDRCNLRCTYCLAPEGVKLVPQGEILSLEEMLQILAVAMENGVKRIRITGGEPLLRRGLAPFLATVRQLPGLEDLSLTTNGLLLEEMARSLRRAGVDRLNISLDTLKPDRFRAIARGGDLAKVWRGLDAAEKEGFSPIKINTVLLRKTQDEISDFIRLTYERPFHVRFIELMPLGEGDCCADEFLPLAEAMAQLESFGPVAAALEGGGPARYFRLPEALGTVGFIAAISHNFCGNCRRIRLGADGYLSNCLAEEGGIDLKEPLRQGASRERLRELFRRAIFTKPREGDFRWERKRSRAMSRIGG